MPDHLCNCRICGYRLSSEPLGKDNHSPSWDICPCCGVEFGYEDGLLSAIRHYRNEWLAKGAPWFDERMKPINFCLLAQLSNINQEFR